MTAVITKYKRDYNKWIVANPRFPDPVHISCLADIKPDHQYLYIRPISGVSRMLDKKLVLEECKRRLNLFVGIVSDYPSDVRHWNKKYPNDKAVLVYDRASAKKYWFKEVVLGKFHYRLPDSMLLVAICETRLIR